jgi:hypothetical protein
VQACRHGSVQLHALQAEQQQQHIHTHAYNWQQGRHTKQRPRNLSSQTVTQTTIMPTNTTGKSIGWVMCKLQQHRT